MFKHKFLSIVLVTGCALVSSVGAQIKQRTYDKYYGVANASGHFQIHGRVSRETRTQHVTTIRRGRILRSPVKAAVHETYAHIKNDIRFFGNSAEAAKLSATAKTVYGPSSSAYGNARLRIFGFTRWSVSADAEIPLLNYGFSRGFSKIFRLGPLEFRVKGSVNAGVEAGLELSALFAGVMDTLWTAKPKAGIGGYGKCWANGSGSVSTYGVGVRSDLRFAKAKLTPSLLVDLNSVRGFLTLNVEPIRFLLKVWARIKVNLGFYKVRKTISKTVLNWSLGRYDRTLQLF